MILNALVFATALAAPVALVQEKALPERQVAFLKAVQAGKIQDAYKELLRGSPILEKQADVDNLVAQTEKGVGIYGGVTSFEDMGLLRQHRNVAFGVSVLACEKAPLYFYFVWFRPREEAPWRIQNAWFDDNSRAFFDARK